MTGLCYLVPLPELHDSEGTGEGLCGAVLDDQGGFFKSFWQPRSKTVQDLFLSVERTLGSQGGQESRS